MKLTYFQLEAQLAKKLSPVYIVSGEELLLKQDAISLIRKAAKKNGIEERTRLTPTAGFDWEELYTLLYSSSLLAEKRLLELDFRHAMPNKVAATILEEYGKKPVSDHILLIDMGKLDSKITKNAWYQSLEKIGMVIPIWPITHEQLPQWIIQRARKYHLSLDQDTARLLSEYVEGNLAAAAQALEKIYLFHSKTRIDAALIKTVLTDESRFSVFDFVETLISGHPSQTLRILDNLKEEGAEPILILWGIIRELRLLADLALQLKQGSSFEMLWQKQRIFSRRQAAIRHFLTRNSAEKCWEYLTHAVQIDRIIKGAAKDNIWNALQLFCLRIQNTLAT